MGLEIVAYIPDYPPTSYPQPLIDTGVGNLRQLYTNNDIKLYLYGSWNATTLANTMLGWGLTSFYVRINGNYSNTIDIYKRLGAIE